MNAQQFYLYIENPEKLGIHEEVQIRGVLKEYPYFQSAHILLAKCLKNMDNYTFEKQLRTASVFASNRAVLYQLLKSKKVSSTATPVKIQELKVEQKTEEQKIDVLEQAHNMTVEEPVIITQKKEPVEVAKPIEAVNVEQPKAPVEIELKLEVEPVEQVTLTHETPTQINVEANPVNKNQTTDEVDPLLNRREEIANQYREFLRKKELSLNALIVQNKKEIEIEKIVETEKPKEENKIEPIEIIVSHSHIEPEIAIPQPEKVIDHLPQPQSTEHSFSEWLKLNQFNLSAKQVDLPEPIISVQTIVENENPSKPDAIDVDNILDRFINSNPTISRPKAEFFNPVKAAQKSLEDNDDLITETLAGMYEKQGNFNKAISMYEKLSLKYPEKSLIFAARIQEIKNKIN
jgi:tetratricopeptide (TPR) repeat protein